MRLIDADALKTVHGMRDDCAECDKEERKKSVKCEYDRVFTKMDFCGWLDDAPTVDVAPVRRGRWLDGYKRQTCSLCKGSGFRSWQFCPYCGANMREDDHETD